MARGRPLIVGLGGTLRDGSYSRAALAHTLALAAADGAATELLDLRDLGLPMHVPDLPLKDYSEHDIPSINRLLDAFRRGDAFVWSSATYHGTVTGIFKNALDMLELLVEDDPPYLTGKAVGLIAVADASPLASMASSVHELRAWTAPTRLTLFDTDFTPGLELKDGAPVRRATRLAKELLFFARGRTHG